MQSAFVRTFGPPLNRRCRAASTARPITRSELPAFPPVAISTASTTERALPKEPTPRGRAPHRPRGPTVSRPRLRGRCQAGPLAPESLPSRLRPRGLTIATSCLLAPWLRRLNSGAVEGFCFSKQPPCQSEKQEEKSLMGRISPIRKRCPLNATDLGSSDASKCSGSAPGDGALAAPAAEAQRLTSDRGSEVGGQPAGEAHAEHDCASSSCVAKPAIGRRPVCDRPRTGRGGVCAG